jgi:hypothetical protein
MLLYTLLLPRVTLAPHCLLLKVDNYILTRYSQQFIFTWVPEIVIVIVLVR